MNVTFKLLLNVKSPMEGKRYVEDLSNLSVCVSASHLLDIYHLQTGVHKAIYNYQSSLIKTKSLANEVLYQLSPTSKINIGVSQYEVNESSTYVVIVLIGDKLESSVEDEIKQRFGADEVDINRLSSFLDESKISIITKLFKVSEEELKISSLSSAVMMRIAVKDFI